MNEHPFMRGVGLGMIAGATVGAMVMKKEKSLKRAAHHTAKNVGRLAEDTVNMVADKLPR